MELLTQYQIKSNDKLKAYLRDNSYWYKYLNRNQSYIYDLKKQMEKAYKLTSQDRFNKFVSNINLINQLMDILK